MASANFTFSTERKVKAVLELLNHQDAAHDVAKWLTKNEHDAQDVVQEAYVRAIQHFRGFRGDNARAWLLTIVRNQCYSSMRRRGVRKHTTPFTEQIHSPRKTDPEAALLQRERLALLRRALDQLPAALREVLVLYELEERSYREIADMAGIPIGTVMSRLSRGRERLQQVLLFPKERTSGKGPPGRERGVAA